METTKVKDLANYKLKKIRGYSPVLYVKNSDAIHCIEKDEITFLEASGNYCIINTLSNGKILSSKTLKFYCNLIEGSKFIRIHQSYLVNIRFISEVKLQSIKQVVLRDGTYIPVSRSRLPELLSKLQN